MPAIGPHSRAEGKIEVTIGRQEVLGCVLAALAVGFLTPLHVAAEGAFFQGKQVRFYTMGSPGGGYDTYMRALIPHLEKKLSAKMLPTNEPGAGGLIAINRTLHAPPDGLTILLVGGETLVTAQLYDAPGVNYDVRKLTWLGRVSSEAKVALLGPQSPYDTVFDLVKSQRPVTWAGSSKIDGNADFTAIMAHALGMKSKIITGYKGTGDMNLAIQRGEVDGRIVSEESAVLYGPSNGMRVVAVLARRRVEQFPAAPTPVRGGEAWPGTGALDRLARRHRRPRPTNDGYAGHAAGSPRSTPTGLCRGHPRRRIHR